MTSKQFDREKKYRTAKALAKKMLDSGIISLADYKKIKDHFIKIYQPVMEI